MRTLAALIFALFTLCVLHLPLMGLPSAANLLSDDSASTASVVSALQNGNFDDALRMCNQLLRESPKSPKLWTLRAVALDRSGRMQDALDSYRQALKFAPDYLAALEGAAQLQYKAKSKDAIPLLQRILAAQPANQTAHAMLGAIEYRQKDYAKAAADFDAAGDLVRSQPAALMDDSLCLIHLDRGAEAMQNLKELLQLTPENSDARYDLALVEWRVSSAADALATLQPVLDANPPDARAMRLAAAIHESGNETPQAVELLRSAILADPDDLANYLDFATLAFAHGSFSVGVDIVSAGIARLPNAAPLYMARGVLYGQNGDLNKAIDDFEHAHRLDPVDSMAATAEGIAHSQHQNNRAALADFRRQVKEHPKDALGYYLLAEALSWAPSNADGKVTASLAEAIATVEKATALDPNLVQAWDLRASLELQANDLILAAKASRTALALEPKDQQALYTLILALRKSHSKQELDSLVRELTELRKEEQIANSQKNRYGRLVESP